MSEATESRAAVESPASRRSRLAVPALAARRLTEPSGC